jgi:hypothetical protein
MFSSSMKTRKYRIKTYCLYFSWDYLLFNGAMKSRDSYLYFTVILASFTLKNAISYMALFIRSEANRSDRLGRP